MLDLFLSFSRMPQEKKKKQLDVDSLGCYSWKTQACILMALSLHRVILQTSCAHFKVCCGYRVCIRMSLTLCFACVWPAVVFSSFFIGLCNVSDPEDKCLNIIQKILESIRRFITDTNKYHLRSRSFSRCWASNYSKFKLRLRFFFSMIRVSR